MIHGGVITDCHTLHCGLLIDFLTRSHPEMLMHGVFNSICQVQYLNVLFRIAILVRIMGNLLGSALIKMSMKI